MAIEEDEQSAMTRIRVLFDDEEILNDSQRSEGLNQTWMLLNHQILPTISHLSSYLLGIFHLHHSCSNGILLSDFCFYLSYYLLSIFHLHHSCSNGILFSMDGFVLPPFESTYILKDKEIISIRRKGSASFDIVEGDDDLIAELENVEKQTGVQLLANKEFDYQSEREEDEDSFHVQNSPGTKAVSKKRKPTEKLQSPRKKKQQLVVPTGVQNDAHRENTESNQNDGALRSKSNRQEFFGCKRKPCVDNTSEIADGSNENGNTDQIQETGEGIDNGSHVPNGMKKVPSRSTRRQYAKRKWLKELRKAEKKDDTCKTDGPLYRKQERAKTKKKEAVSRPKGLLHWKKLPDVDPISDVEDDVVAIVDRPGHIRFEPLANVDAEQMVLQTPVPMKKFQSTGNTNKKSSRKCRKQNLPSPITKKDLNKIYSEALATEKELHIDFPIDFDNLPPLTTVAESITEKSSWPKLIQRKVGSLQMYMLTNQKECAMWQLMDMSACPLKLTDGIDWMAQRNKLPILEGDVIAYRLIELSSSWNPELSPFKVGKILWCDPQSTKIMLMPISEKKDGDANSEKLDELLHSEDGKLEVDFKVLIDVRVVKHGDSVLANPIASKQPLATVTKEGEVNPLKPPEDMVNPWERLQNKVVNPWEQLTNREVENPWEKLTNREVENPWEQLTNREVVNPWEQLTNREVVNPWEQRQNREVNPRGRCSEVAFTKKACFYGKNGYKNRMRK